MLKVLMKLINTNMLLFVGQKMMRLLKREPGVMILSMDLSFGQLMVNEEQMVMV
jgi:hypothetical protein